MPRSAPSTCSEPMCAALVHDGKSKCLEHRAIQKREQSNAYKHRDTNAKFTAFYNGMPWRRLSTTHRRKEPLCMHCLEHNITKPADVVDHIIEIRDDYSKRFDTTNLMSLCHACHNTKTALARKNRV